ncbi:Conserved_hypothetical protein [Hexamita inflata]|uniref:Uncharacterized protein n=1 Tax=Hexamita inflata TaxID=28002 RepID=A0AA86QCI3_9EUKA|nr:Conserved hypothetical protein [Hexamita inflata]
MCGSNNLVYGICQDKLQFSESVNGMFECVHPFEFINNSCMCVQGYILNISRCVDIISQLTSLSQQLTNSSNCNLCNSSLSDEYVKNMMDENSQKLQNYILNNISSIDNKLLTNTSALDQRIYDNITIIKELLQQYVQTINDLKQQLNCTTTNGYQYINNSCIEVNCQIQGQQSTNGKCQCTIINAIVLNNQCTCPNNSTLINNTCICDTSGQIIQAGVCVCQTTSAFLLNGSCTCGQYAVNSSNTCSCPAQSVLVNQVCECNVSLGLTMINGSCQCLDNQTIVNGSCFNNYQISSLLDSLVCIQPVYITMYNIFDTTLVVNDSSDLSVTGFVFATSQIIQNSVIELSSNVYNTTVIPLFQNQLLYQNIKIILGGQMVTSGSILTNQDIIIINELQMISKQNYSIINTGLLNFLQVTSKNANITNLTLNCRIITSLGNISLINNITGNFSILNFQILGYYQSNACVALVGLSFVQANAIIKNINFMPSQFNIGNMSAYLISQVQGSSVNISQIVIVVGNSSNQQILTAISSTVALQFGGIICQTNNSTTNIVQVIYDCHQTYSSQNMQNTGLLVGYAIQQLNTILIKQICMQQVLSSIKLIHFGVIGIFEGKLQLQELSIKLDSGVSYFEGVGIIGLQTTNCINSSFNNIFITTNMLASTGSQVNGGIVGYQLGINTYVQNINLNNSNLNSTNYAGGIVGLLSSTSVFFVENSTIQFSNFSTTGHSCSGIIAYSTSSRITVINSQINTIKLTAGSFTGLIFGYNAGGNTFNIINSPSNGNNYINNNWQANCANMGSPTISRGC